MDATDFKIVKILQNKARIPNVEVARQIGMAPSAVLERIKKLEARGIIDGYEVRLNPERFNRAMIAFVEIRVRDAAAIRETGRKLADLAAVQEVHFLAGNDSLLIKLRVSDTNELETLLMTEISAIQAILSTKTEIALATFKETARIPITDTEEQP